VIFKSAKDLHMTYVKLVMFCCRCDFCVFESNTVVYQFFFCFSCPFRDFDDIMQSFGQGGIFCSAEGPSFWQTETS